MLIPTLQIGSLTVRPATVLAPMEGLTDAPFRAMIHALGGCGLVVTELVSAKEMSLKTRHALNRSDISSDPSPRAIQIYGRDPRLMAEAAGIAQERGASLVDINMGCPSHAVTRHGGGAALMRDPGLVKEITAAVRAAVTIPVTAKMRLGWDPTTLNALEIALICQEEGIDAVTVHGRTRAQLYTGQADWKAIGRVKEKLRIPVIGNGDILTPQDALKMLETAQVDGVMIGRGAIKNPWLILQSSQALAGEAIREPTLEERRRGLMAYLRQVQSQVSAPEAALGRTKKVMGLFTEGVPAASSLRKAVLHAGRLEDAMAAVELFFSSLEEGRAAHRGDEPMLHVS